MVGPAKEILAFCELPLYVAVRVAVWLEVMVPVLTDTVAALTPAAMVTEACTANSGLLLASETAVPLFGAACDNITVQLPADPLGRLLGVHDIELTSVGATRGSIIACELPL